MKTITKTEATKRIESYKKDIAVLEEMKNMYDEKVNNLFGGFYTGMVDEINEQIEFCKECISNLEKFNK